MSAVEFECEPLWTPPPVLVPPLYLWVPPRASSAAREVFGFMDSFGRPPDGEQALALDCLLSERWDTRWAAFTAAIVEARQNGKTAAVMLPCAMADLWLFGCETVLWTAHQQSTSDKTFEDLKELIAGCAALSRRVRSIISSHGQHTVTLITGASMHFMTRTARAGRGFDDVESITFDEAQELQQFHLGALIPTMGVADFPQVRYAGSAGHAKSAVWRGIRNRGRRGALDPSKGDPTLAYAEWGARVVACERGDCRHAEGTTGCQLDNRDRWQEANHSMRSPLVPAGRNQVETITAFRQSMSAGEFAREIMSWWDEAPGENPVGSDTWAGLALLPPFPLVPSRASKVITVDVSPGMRSAAVVMSVRMPSGKIRIEVIKYEDGTEWTVAELARLKKAHRCPVVLVRNSPAGPLIGDLNVAKPKVEPYCMSEVEYAASCGLFQSLIDSGMIEHLGDPVLTAALDGAVKKDVGDGPWKWARQKSTDICALVAATLGPWALANVPQPGNMFASKA